LLGISARTVRDYPLPRAEDGTYNIRDVIQHCRGRIARPELPDDDYERVLVLVERFIRGLDDGATVGIQRAISDLVEPRGEGALLVFLDEFHKQVADDAGYWQEDLRWDPPTDVEVREQLERQRKEHAEFVATVRDLKYAILCDKCRKLRRGRNWVKEKPPAGYHVTYGLCPECDGKR
jgi:hypothetical protein